MLSFLGDQVEENVKRMVLENCDIFLKKIPKELQSRLDRKLPNMTSFGSRKTKIV